MPKIKIPIHAGWMPDAFKTDVAKLGGLVTANNVLPVQGAYVPILDKAEHNSNALTGTPLNGTYAQDTSGQYYNYVGTTSKLYRFDSVTLTDITRASGGNYTSTEWAFQRYGTWMIATNFNDDPQVLKGFTADNFQALGGSPPKARYVLLNSGHLIFANLDESGTLYPKKLTWSARESIEDYTPSLTTGADSQEFPDMDGNITGLGSIGDAFVIAAENSLSVGYYIGGVYTFGFKTNAIQNIGCFYPRSFISVGDKVFFWSKESIYMFDGTNIVDIGKPIKKHFFASVNMALLEKISVSQDKDNGLILWSYVSTDSETVPDKVLVYNWIENRFTTFDLSCECIFSAATGGLILDNLDTTLIDDLEYLIDAGYWFSKDIQPIIAFTDNKLYSFAGSALTTEIETGELVDLPNKLFISKAYLPLEGASTTGSVTVKHRNTGIAAQSSSTASSIKSDGTVDLRTTNRCLSLNASLSSYTKIGNIIEAEIASAGGR